MCNTRRTTFFSALSKKENACAPANQTTVTLVLLLFKGNFAMLSFCVLCQLIYTAGQCECTEVTVGLLKTSAAKFKKPPRRSTVDKLAAVQTV